MYTLFQIDSAVRQMLDLGDTSYRAIPVRKERLDDLFADGKVDLDLLCDELGEFLSDNPQYRENYRELLGRLTYQVGIKWGLDGFSDAAAHYFGLGLRWNPENFSLRSNYAVALHLAGRTDQALAEYLHLIREDNIGASPLIWILAARICHEKGHLEAARDLLEACGQVAPTEDSIWEFYARVDDLIGDQSELTDQLTERDRKEMAEFLRTGGKTENTVRVDSSRKGPSSTAEIAPELRESEPHQEPPPAAPTIMCPSCSLEVLADSSFCRHCGAKVERQAADDIPETTPVHFCFKCGTELDNPDAAFCRKCGAKLS